MTRTRHSKRERRQPLRGSARKLKSDHPSHGDPNDMDLLLLRPTYPVEEAQSVLSHVGRAVGA
jgi:hypothetical protein